MSEETPKRGLKSVIHYQKQSFSEESEFSEILENEEEFENVVIQCLKEDLSRYGERGEYAAGAEIIIDEKKKATVLKCDIHGAISESEGEYYTTFKWLLVPPGLDFIILYSRGTCIRRYDSQYRLTFLGYVKFAKRKWSKFGRALASRISSC